MRSARSAVPPWAPRAAAAAILLVGCLAALSLNWPGQLSYDSVVQLHDGRFGHYNAWHPPVMAWMLGLADTIVPGAGLFILFNALVLFGSLLSLLWIRPNVSWFASAVAALCVVLPQFVLYQGIVWKDVLFADAAVAGFVALAHAARHWAQPRSRWILLALGVTFLSLAALARQNGGIVLVVAAAAVIPVARRSSWGITRSLAWGFGVLTIELLIVALAGFALSLRENGDSGPVAQLRLLEFYDIIGAVKDTPTLRLDILARASPDLEQLIRSDGVRLYTPVRNDTLVGSAELQSELADTKPAVMASQWRAMIFDHPLGYLRVRSRVFGWLFFTWDAKACSAYYAGVDGPSSYLRDLGLTRRIRPGDRALAGYAARFAGTPLLSHATYALLALGLLVLLVRRGRPADFAMAFLLVAALAFTLSFFVISIACDYRYLLFLDLASLAALFYWAIGGTGQAPVEAVRI